MPKMDYFRRKSPKIAKRPAEAYQKKHYFGNKSQKSPSAEGSVPKPFASGGGCIAPRPMLILNDWRMCSPLPLNIFGLYEYFAILEENETYILYFEPPITYPKNFSVPLPVHCLVLQRLPCSR